MSSLLPHRRAAEEFARILDGEATPDGRYDELLACVTQLEAHSKVLPRPEFSTSLRSRLMMAADEVLVPTTSDQQVVPFAEAQAEPSLAPSRRERRFGALAAAFVLLGTSAGVAAAAQGSLPGDTLYPIKRGVESARAAIVPTDSGKAQQLFNQADNRLKEATQMVHEGATVEQLNKVFGDFTGNVLAGSYLVFDIGSTPSTSQLEKLLTFSSTSLERLSQLVPLVPAPAHGSLANAAKAVTDLYDRSAQMCLECSPGSRGELPADLLFSFDELEAALTSATNAHAAPGEELNTYSERLSQSAQKVAKTLAKESPAPADHEPAADADPEPEPAPKPEPTAETKPEKPAATKPQRERSLREQVKQVREQNRQKVRQDADTFTNLIDDVTLGLSRPLTALADALLDQLLGELRSDDTASKTPLSDFLNGFNTPKSKK